MPQRNLTVSTCDMYGRGMQLIQEEGGCVRVHAAVVDHDGNVRPAEPESLSRLNACRRVNACLYPYGNFYFPRVEIMLQYITGAEGFGVDPPHQSRQAYHKSCGNIYTILVGRQKSNTHLSPPA